jgi:hypothetical protein
MTKKLALSSTVWDKEKFMYHLISGHVDNIKYTTKSSSGKFPLLELLLGFSTSTVFSIVAVQRNKPQASRELMKDQLELTAVAVDLVSKEGRDLQPLFAVEFG